MCIVVVIQLMIISYQAIIIIIIKKYQVYIFIYMKSIKIPDIFIEDENDILIVVDKLKTSFQIIVNTIFQGGKNRDRSPKILYKAMYRQIVFQKTYTELLNAFFFSFCLEKKSRSRKMVFYVKR